MRLFHLVVRAVWDDAVRTGTYRPATLDSEGFVHFSFADQVRRTYEKFYTDVPDLVVVEIDPSRVDEVLRIEDTYGTGEAFPHVYGPIPTDAAVAVHQLSEFSAAGP